MISVRSLPAFRCQRVLWGILQVWGEGGVGGGMEAGVRSEHGLVHWADEVFNPTAVKADGGAEIK